MTATLKITNLQNESSLTPNIVLNADGTTTIASTTVTALTTSGNLNFTGTGNRITGDFSNSTIASRVTFQTSTTNGNTLVAAMPNGTATTAGLWAFNNSDLTNAGRFRLTAQSSEMALVADYNGTGTYLPMTFYTGGAERLRLDTSGNLGLGVTPSAWGTNYKAIQLNATTVPYVISNNQYLGVGANYYRDGSGNHIYVTSSVASNYVQDASAHKWFTAPSGTAGNAISFTQAMTLTADGDFVVGKTSPTFVASGRRSIEVNGATDSLLVFSAGGSGIGYLYASATEARLAAFANVPLTFFTNNTEKVRIDSSGNLLVGTTSPQARITAATTNADSFSSLITGNSGSGLVFNRPSSSGTVINTYHLFNGVLVGSITMTSSATAYATSSDYRLKENVAPMTGALATVAQLKPCTYTWKTDGKAGQGFIAHELQAVVPDAVTGEKDAVDAEGNPQYQGVDTSFLVATLTAALQEQQAIITQLQADVAALKGAA